MTSDDQQFLDLLASVPQDLATYGGRIADYIERRTNLLAGEIRDAIDSATWIPESLKPPHHHTPSASLFRTPPPPQTLYQKTVAFVSANSTAIAITVAFISTTAYLAHRRRKAHARKRRARRFPNGAKKEIVVLVCPSLHDPSTRGLALDLERRGYIVYVTVSTTEEDTLIQREARPDLRPLWLDLSLSVPSHNGAAHPDLEPIRQLLSSSVPSSPYSRPSRQTTAHTLAGVILFPGIATYPIAPLSLLPSTTLIDSINTRLVHPLLTIQQLLPLLAQHSPDSSSPSSIVIAYPSIPASLTPPSEFASTLVSGAHASLAASLRHEISASNSNITIHELKLGNFDFNLPAQYHRTHNPMHYSQSASSHSDALVQYQRPQSSKNTSIIPRSSTRELHNAVFDALAPPQVFRAFNRFEWHLPKRNSTQFVGSGARTYSLLGRCLPESLVGLMMGYRPIRLPSLSKLTASTKTTTTERDEQNKADTKVELIHDGLGSDRSRMRTSGLFKDEERVWGEESTSDSDAGLGKYTPPSEDGREEGESTVWEKV